MAFTSAPPVPSIGASDFAARAAAFVDWQANTHVPELNAALLAWGPGAPYADDVGGTPNARTITTGINVGLVAGQRVLWKVPTGGGNTGPATANVDGTGAVSMRTITGAPLPSGFLVGGTIHEMIYDGSVWVVRRPPEKVSGVDAIRHENGVMEWWGSYDDTAAAWTTAQGNFFVRSATISIAFGVTFTAIPSITRGARGDTPVPLGVNVRTATTTGCGLQPWAGGSIAAGAAKFIDIHAVGSWY